MDTKLAINILENTFKKEFDIERLEYFFIELFNDVEINTVEEKQFVFTSDFEKLNTVEDGFVVEYHPNVQEAIESALRLFENLYGAEAIADCLAEGNLASLDYSPKGIAAKDLPNIFERFYRTDASRNSSKGGSGIGLSIVKKIIEDHGGYIWATSKENEGTCMHFLIRKYQVPPET